jgi:RNA polymerase sigma-70 factor (ECF subfamily)
MFDGFGLHMESALRDIFLVPSRSRPVNASSRDTAAPAMLDQLLIAVATTRDREAFGLLFRHFAPRLKAFLMHGGFRADVAEELAQETMAMVWRKAAAFDVSRGGASTWIFTIARNLRIDYGRRARRDQFTESDPADEQDAPQLADAAIVTAERESQLRVAMTSLSDDQRTVLRLAFFSDKPHSEIARELGLPLGTVKSRVRLAMSRLRALLDNNA